MPNDLINQLKYYVLQLGDPNPNLSDAEAVRVDVRPRGVARRQQRDHDGGRRRAEGRATGAGGGLRPGHAAGERAADRREHRERPHLENTAGGHGPARVLLTQGGQAEPC